MSISLQAFLARVREIDAEKPAYRNGGSGTDGTCDCIGLVIGAIRRAGGKWDGIHGSNWAARHEVGALRAVSGADALRVGEIVFKKHERGESGWALPARYANDADQRDYYHAGVVLSVSPLDIVHCTEPTTRHDNKLGKWSYAAELKAVAYDKGEDGMTDEGMTALYRAMVTTEKDPLRVRDWPVTGRIIGHVPRGRMVDVLDEGEDGWPRIRYGELVGYASGTYLTRVCEADEPAREPQTHPPDEGDASGDPEQGADTVTIPRDIALELYLALSRTLNAD